MSRGSGGKTDKAGRHVTPDEAELWHQLTRSLHKVKTKPRVTAHGESRAASPPAPPALGQRPERRSSQAAVQPAASPRMAQPPPPTEFDRRTLRQVAAGKVPIDATLDLHGLRQDKAHPRLRAFLVSSQAKGHRMLLIITGKGAAASGGASPLAADPRSDRQRGDEGSDPASAPRGVLRRIVPQWLDEPELRAIVLSYAEAGVRHGGAGALYVRLRKAREA